MMHQLNMRMSVALLRDVDAERRAKEKAEAPTVKTELQTKREEEAKEKEQQKEKKSATGTKTTTATTTTEAKKKPFQNIWTRKFRALPEDKAVDLFADVVGDTFILGVAVALILYEYWRSQKKPDSNKERIEELNTKLEESQQALREAEEKTAKRLETLELALQALQDPKTKKPLLPSLQEAVPTPTPTPTPTA